MTDIYEDQVTALAQNLHGCEGFDIDCEQCGGDELLSTLDIDGILNEITDPSMLEPSDFGILIARWMERADHPQRQELMQFLADRKVALLYPAR
jgi:hypothetical protein